jgi:hypothetical protein
MEQKVTYLNGSLTTVRMKGEGDEMDRHDWAGVALIACFLAIPFLSNTDTGFAFFMITVALYVTLFLPRLRRTVGPWLRRAFLGALVAATMLLLTGGHAILNNRIERQVAAARLKADLDYERAHPRREEPACRSARPWAWLDNPACVEQFQESLDRWHPTGHKPGDPGFWPPWSVASRPLSNPVGHLSPEEEVEAKAEEAWRRSHWIQCTAEKALYVPASITINVAAIAPDTLKRVGSYLSFPFKLALGVGFGIALGAWIVKNWT